MTGFSGFTPDGGGASSSALAGSARMVGPRWLRLPALTGGLLGVSVFWSVEMTYAPPYLLSLGVSKSHMALVFAAGPISGLLVQPIIGVLSDSCKSRWGRRRPYIALGSLFTIGAMLLLGFTRPVASIFTLRGTAANDSLTIFMAVLAIYCLDFAINAVMAVDRSLIVDTLPAEDQLNGSAWATYMAVIGGVVGLYIGVIDLPKVLPWLGNTQLQSLAILASLLFFGTHAAAVFVAREKILLARSDGKAEGLVHQLRDLWSTAKSLPSTIRRIFAIQFFSSVAWFPIFNYLTVYISDLHSASFPPTSSAEEAANRAAEGTRLGTRALLFSALVAFTATLVSPPFVVGGAGEGEKPGVVEKALVKVGVKKVPKIHLARLWAITFGVFAGCMFATVFVTKVETATLIIAITGLPSAMGTWAPFALVGEVIRTSTPDSTVTDADSSIGMIERRRGSLLFDAEAGAGEEREQFLARHADADEDEDGRADGGVVGGNGVLGNPAARMSSLDLTRASVRIREEREGEGHLGAKAGTILAMMNIFIVIPQFIVTALAAFIFAVVEPSSSFSPPDGAEPALPPNAVGILFRFGGIAAVVGAVLAWRLARDLTHGPDGRFGF